jgi:RNA polymerase sigma-70 factor (ECF subfamily)
MQSTSASLLERLRQPGEREAWTRFVNLYTPILFAWTRQLGQQPQDAADLVQEVFLVLMRRMPDFSYDKSKGFRRWLRTVTLNKWRDACRRRVAGPDTPAGADLEQVPGPAKGEELEEAEYRGHLVNRALQLMQSDFQPITWKACWEFVVNGRPAADVANELAITVNAVYLAKSRVLRRLRTELDGLLD